MIEWLKQMKNAFGASFLWLICLVYFTQGFKSFVWTAVSYMLKDVLKCSPSVSQFVISVAFVPWSIKPLYGILSDCIPIKGRRRIPYIAIATVLSFFPWIILGVNVSLRTSRTLLMLFLTLQNIGSAMADVVVDAMIAEAVRFERAKFAGDLQSLSWFSMAFGGICGSVLGGYALDNLQIETIFLLFAALPALQLISCSLVEEKPVDSIPEVSHLKNENGDTPNGDNNDNSRARRRKKNKTSKAKRENNTSATYDNSRKNGSLTLKWFYSFKSAAYSLFCAFKQPMILRPITWFFLAHVTIPNLSTIMFYYQTEFLKLDASFLGTARVIGWIGLMIGTFIYNRYFKKMKLRRILMWAHIGLSALTLLDMVLVSRLNISYGVSDKVMVMSGSALADAINQLKFMPFLILSGKLCPPGIEGTLFALFMSINNLGVTVGSFVGAGLASLLNISSGSFDKLLLGTTIQFLCTFIPVAFLFLIPKEATGVSE